MLYKALITGQHGVVSGWHTRITDQHGNITANKTKITRHQATNW